MKIRKEDQVLIIRGKDKGKKSKVLRGFPEESKILVENVNMKKKHHRPKKEGEKGQVIEIAAPIPVSNVKLICPKCGKPTKAGYGKSGEKKHRLCKKCNQEI